MKPVLIWTYHRVLPDNGSSAVPQEIFDLQLRALVDAGYEFIDVGELLDIYNGDVDPGKRKLTMLTFDDGWADNLLWATPVLQEYSAKAVMAVNTALVNPGRSEFINGDDYKIVSSKDALEQAAYKRDFSSFLTWDEMRILKDTGVWDFQAHGNCHLGCCQSMKNPRGFYPDFKHWTMEYAFGGELFDGAPRCEFDSILAERRTRPTAEFIEALKAAENNEQRMKICMETDDALEFMENEMEFRERIRGDMLICKNLLEEKLDVRSKAMFWPWGHYSDDSIEAAQDCGFELMFTMNKDSLRSTVNTAHEIPRIAAPATISRFKKQLKVFTNPVLKSIRDIFSK